MSDIDTNDPFAAAVRHALIEDAQRAPQLPAEWTRSDNLTAPSTVVRWPSWRYLAAVAAAAVMLVGGLIVIAARSGDVDPADVAATGTPPAWIAFVGDMQMIDAPPRLPPLDDMGGDFLSDIFIVGEDGSGFRNLTSTPDVNEYAPAWSPDGTRLAFLRDLRVGSARLVIVDMATLTETTDVNVTLGARSDTYGSVMWSPDGDTIEVYIANSPHHQFEIATKTWTEYPQVGRSPDGRWVTLFESVGTSIAPYDLVIVPADGFDPHAYEETPIRYAESHAVGRVRFDELTNSEAWSPDGTKLLVSIPNHTTTSAVSDSCASSRRTVPPDERIELVEVPDGTRQVLTEDGFDPSWSPDGKQFAFLRNPSPGEGSELWVAAADGSDQRRVGRTTIVPSWSPDSRRLLAATSNGLYTISPDGLDTITLTFGTPQGGRSMCLSDTTDTGLPALPSESATWQTPSH